ncbi:MAG TPA: UvrD-helicase domain-containing protein [Bryobacteraceae bacterium]|nr:UvrD-helicase domain-containing protein [Bryobacteraceae bacterium]
MDFLQGLNPQQQAAVAHVKGPLLLLAGAGSGKTRVITHRIAHLIEAHRVPGPCILAVTFTNKAAEEMRQRVHNLLGGLSSRENPLVSTFHSFCVRLLRRDGDRLAELRPGFTKKFTIYDEDDQVALIKSIFKATGLDEKFMSYRGACSWISHNKSGKKSPQEVYGASTDPNTTRLASVYEQYEARLRQANALDFDDLLLETVRLLAHDADLRRQYNQRFEFVMIDEYQDTNRTQYELIRLLTEGHKNLCVVGDEDQSIYGWRGADIRNILDFERDYPNAAVIRLEQNYRSTKNILEAASAVVANNTERKGKWLWTTSGAGERIARFEAFDGEQEALFIADTIEKLLTASPEDRAAVLYRTNFQSRQIEEALRRYGRKYVVVGGFSFYQRAEIKDTLAYLKVLSSPHDSVSLLRIINTPARGIGKSTIEQIEQYALEHELSIWSAIGRMLDENAFPPRAEAALRAFRNMIQELAAMLATAKVSDVLEEILARTGYTKMLQGDKDLESESRLDNLNELINASSEAAERGEGVAEFLDHAALVSDSDNLDERAQVSLLTLHNAKGLEFPIVFLAGLEEGLFPHMRSLDSKAAMEEERRLCYVGMTRAEKRLFLTSARYRRRWGGGESEASIPSRFLSEVPEALVQDLSPRKRTGQVDLYGERQEVREAARRNLYTGKTYNSVENIQQFFNERGKQPVAGPAAPATAAKTTPAGAKTAPAAAKAIPTTNAPQPTTRAKPLRNGSSIIHPKYGRGTVLRREGDGDDAKLTVSFPGYGLKKLIEKYAGIKEE